MPEGAKQLVGRHKRLAFMDTAGTGASYTRMTGFTSLSEGKEATEYSRQYVDEATERTDVVGYATSIDYEFARYARSCPLSPMMSWWEQKPRLILLPWIFSRKTVRDVRLQEKEHTVSFRIPPETEQTL